VKDKNINLTTVTYYCAN